MRTWEQRAPLNFPSPSCHFLRKQQAPFKARFFKLEQARTEVNTHWSRSWVWNLCSSRNLQNALVCVCMLTFAVTLSVHPNITARIGWWMACVYLCPIVASSRCLFWLSARLPWQPQSGWARVGWQCIAEHNFRLGKIKKCFANNQMSNRLSTLMMNNCAYTLWLKMLQ